MLYEHATTRNNERQKPGTFQPTASKLPHNKLPTSRRPTKFLAFKTNSQFKWQVIVIYFQVCRVSNYKAIWFTFTTVNKKCKLFCLCQ